MIYVYLVIALIIISGLRVVQQYERGVTFRLGKIIGEKGPGIRYVIPIIDRLVKISVRIITMPIPAQKIITKDNVSIDVAAVAYYMVKDATKAVISIANVDSAINQIAQTTVRNIVGQFSLDEVLSETVKINEQVKKIIDSHTEAWGVEVTTVEIKDIQLPDTMQRAMAKQAEAEREKRAKIIAAEGEYLSADKLAKAADIISKHPVSLQLRNLQVLSEIAVEKNSTIVFPSNFFSSVKEISKYLKSE